MRRFYVEDIDETSVEARITGDELVHLKRVLRLKAGQRVSVFNGRGLELSGVVASVSGSCASVTIEGPIDPVPEPPVEVHILQGLLKGDRPEFVVEKATELGAASVGFFSSEYSVPSLDPARAGRKAQRLRRAAIGAAKQSGRAVVPSTTLYPSLGEAVRAFDGKDLLRMLLVEPGASTRAARLGDPLSGSPRGVLLLLGPEGGFTPAELDGAVKDGFQPVSLGPRTLRGETAPVAALSILLYELGGMG